MQPISVVVQEVLEPYLERIKNGYPSHPNAHMDDSMLKMWHGESLPESVKSLGTEVWMYGVFVRGVKNVVRWLCMVTADTAGNHAYGGTLFRERANVLLVTRIDTAQFHLEKAVPGATYYLIFTERYNAKLFGVILPDGTERFLPLMHDGLVDDWTPVLLTREAYLALLEHDACPFHSY